MWVIKRVRSEQHWGWFKEVDREKTKLGSGGLRIRRSRAFWPQEVRTSLGLWRPCLKINKQIGRHMKKYKAWFLFSELQMKALNDFASEDHQAVGVYVLKSSTLLYLRFLRNLLCLWWNWRLNWAPDLLAFTSQVIRSQVCTTVPGFKVLNVGSKFLVLK